MRPANTRANRVGAGVLWSWVGALAPPNVEYHQLIIHGESDLRCNIEQSEQLFAVLKYMGREALFVLFEGQSHGLSRGDHPNSKVKATAFHAAIILNCASSGCDIFACSSRSICNPNSLSKSFYIH